MRKQRIRLHKTMDKVIKLLVLAVALVLAYLTVQSVLGPVQFDETQQERELILQKQLKKIAAYEEAYEYVHHKFATEEELVNFLNNGKVYYVTAEGDYTEAMREAGLTERDAAIKGLIKRDTTWVAAKDSLLKDGTDVSTLFNIAGTPNRIKLEVGEISQVIGQDTVPISVFRASAAFEDYLSDLDPGRLKEKIELAKQRKNGFAGLRIGSLEEVKKTGNWE